MFQEMNIIKLGHQKKLMNAIEKLNALYAKATPEQRAQLQQRPPTVLQKTQMPMVYPASPTTYSPLAVTPIASVKAMQSAPTEAQAQIHNRLTQNTRPGMSSFKENVGLSLELQQALNKRQRLISNSSQRSADSGGSGGGGQQSPRTEVVTTAAVTTATVTPTRVSVAEKVAVPKTNGVKTASALPLQLQVSFLLLHLCYREFRK